MDLWPGDRACLKNVDGFLFTKRRANIIKKTTKRKTKINANVQIERINSACVCECQTEEHLFREENLFSINRETLKSQEMELIINGNSSRRNN